jgi:hypothetical protein
MKFDNKNEINLYIFAFNPISLFQKIHIFYFRNIKVIIQLIWNLNFYSIANIKKIIPSQK